MFFAASDSRIGVMPDSPRVPGDPPDLLRNQPAPAHGSSVAAEYGRKETDMTAPTVERSTGTMRRVNDLIWKSLDRGGYAQPVAFFCECGQEGCTRPVWLALEEYERRRLERSWRALLPEHEDS